MCWKNSSIIFIIVQRSFKLQRERFHENKMFKKISHLDKFSNRKIKRNIEVDISDFPSTEKAKTDTFSREKVSKSF